MGAWLRLFLRTLRGILLGPSFNGRRWAAGCKCPPALSSPCGLVSQHGRPAAILGLAKAGATVSVAYAGKTYTTIANPDPFAVGWNSPLASNSWRVELDPQRPGPAKGNITVSYAGCDTNASTAVLQRVLFGEVLICSGAFPGKARHLRQD